MTPTEQALHQSMAAHLRWAFEPDRTAATEPARRGLEAKYERLVDERFPGISGAERAKRIRNLRSAQARKAALARWRK